MSDVLRLHIHYIMYVRLRNVISFLCISTNKSYACRFPFQSVDGCVADVIGVDQRAAHHNSNG